MHQNPNLTNATGLTTFVALLAIPCRNTEFDLKYTSVPLEGLVRLPRAGLKLAFGEREFGTYANLSHDELFRLHMCSAVCQVT